VKRIVEKLRSVLLNQWWIEPALPVVLAVLIFLALTYILVAGTKRDRLASSVESMFIGSAIKHSSSQKYEDEEHLKYLIRTISVKQKDLKKFPATQEGIIKDLDIAVYAEILERVAIQKPKMIYLSWLPASQEPTRQHLSPIIDIRKKYPRLSIFIGYPVEELPNLEPVLLKQLDFLEADDCGRKVQTVCSYNKDWGRWIIQHIINQLEPENFSDPKNRYVSLNLPHFRPNYIMNLPQRDRIPDFSVEQLMSEQVDGRFKNAIVFIGPDYQSSSPSAEEKSVIRKTYTAIDDASGSLSQNGTPFHVFWAQIALMFTEGRFVSVAPRFVSNGLTVLFCVVIIALIRRFGAAIALGTFMLISVGMPLLNFVGMRYFFVYIPVFEVIYGGMMVFLFASMGFLSFQTYQRWRLDQIAKAHEETADLRSNFISVISHNLNTPIAQIQGLLDILRQSHSLKEETQLLSEISNDISLMQLFVRSVLIQSALENDGIHASAISLRKFAVEFQQLVGSPLKKSGATTDINFIAEDDEELDIPFSLDVRSLAHCIANLRILQLRSGGCKSAKIDLCLVIDDQQCTFVIELVDQGQLKEMRAKIQKVDSVKKEDEEMLDKVFADLVASYISQENVQIEWNEKENELHLTIDLT